MTNFRRNILNSNVQTTKGDFAKANLRKIISSPTLVNLLKFYAPLLILLLVAGLQQTVPVQVLTRDIFVTTKAPPYTGLLSNIGILTWCVSFAVCVFTFFLIKSANSQDKKIKAFIIFSGLISFWMMADDFFMLHEEVMPRYLGISERRVLLAQVVSVGFHLIYFRKIILKSTPFKLLGFALLLFACSIGVDMLPIEIDNDGANSNWIFLLEDGSKLIAIATWCLYFWAVCSQQINRFIRNAAFESTSYSLSNKA